MTALLETRRPARQQFDTDRALVTCYLVHTAENVLDQVGADTGAEGVAEFIATRKDAGSYHDLADADSTPEVIPPRWQAFHCRGGVNPWTMSLSFACRSVDWPRMTPERRTAFLVNGARVAVDRIDWIEAQPGFRTPTRPRFLIRRITKAQAWAGETGFTSHGEMDPGRRTDPGPEFPWAEFLALVGEEYDRRHNGDDEMAKTWNLTDLGGVLETVGALYQADAVRRIPAGQDWAAWDLRSAELAGRNAWYAEVVKTLKAGRDPVKLLEFVEWALANPAEAGKL
jgi:hypothetical protein